MAQNSIYLQIKRKQGDELVEEHRGDFGLPGGSAAGRRRLRSLTAEASGARAPERGRGDARQAGTRARGGRASVHPPVDTNSDKKIQEPASGTRTWRRQPRVHGLGEAVEGTAFALPRLPSGTQVGSEELGPPFLWGPPREPERRRRGEVGR